MTTTERNRKKRLREALDKLTEENQRCVLGILQALAFAQTRKTEETMEAAEMTETIEAMDTAVFPGGEARLKQAVPRI
jgi:hypothetical protein